MNWKRTGYLIKADIARRVFSDGRSPGWKSALAVALSPPGAAVILFRLESYFYHQGLYPLAKMLAVLDIVLFGVEIGARAQIDEGLIIGHANGVVIHDNVIIGKNCLLMHQCGLGLREKPGIPDRELRLVIEDDVIVAAGARILGPAVIGHHSLIGMNAVVLDSLPPHCVAVGVPARVVATVEANASYPDDHLAEHRRMGERHRGPRTDLRSTLKLVREDLVHRARIDGKAFSCFNYLKLFLNPPALAVAVFRLQHWLDGLGFRVLAKILAIANIVLFSVEIGPQAKIKGGLVLVHANGVVVNSRVEIGKNCVFYHHNTVAIAPRRGYDPLNDKVVIGDNVLIGAGARMIGNITIGDNCIIGMNAVVNRSLPAGSAAGGIPVRVIKTVIPRELKTNDENGKLSPIGPRSRPSLSETLGLIKADLAHRARLDHKPCSLIYYLKVFFNPPALAVVVARLQIWAARRGLRVAAKMLAIFNIVMFTVEIQSGAEIGPGLVLAHANGVLISDYAVIGRNCVLMHQNSVVIGPREGVDPVDDRIVLADDVVVGLGARLVGNITIGNGSVIGANAVVTRSCPSGSVMVGVPARNVKPATPIGEDLP